MMRCCKHCGSLLEDEATVCNFCGTAFEHSKPMEAVPQMPEETVSEDTAATPSKKRSPKKKLLIVCGIAVGIMAIAVAAYLLFYYPSTPVAAAAAVDKYFSVMLGNADQAESLAPEEYWIKESRNGIRSKEELLEQQTTYIDRYFEAWTESRKQVYGDDFTFAYKVIDSELLTGDEAEKIANALESKYDISEYRIGFIYRLFIKTTFEGSVKKDVYARQVYAVRIGSEWYLVHYLDIDGSPQHIYFLVDDRRISLLT